MTQSYIKKEYYATHGTTSLHTTSTNTVAYSTNRLILGLKGDKWTILRIFALQMGLLMT